MTMFVIGFGAVITMGIIVTIIVATIWGMASTNTIFTSVREGTTKAVVEGIGDNTRFVGYIMNSAGQAFDLSNPITDCEWDIITEVPGVTTNNTIDQPPLFETCKGLPLVGQLLKGVYWIGLPTRKIHRKDFKWTSIEQSTSETGKGGDAINILVPNEKKGLDYIYVLEDTYGFLIQKVDMKDLMELDLRIVFRAQVINPFKAQFRVEKWLESIINRLSQEFPVFVAGLSTAGLNSLRKGLKASGKRIILDDQFATALDDFLNDYGVRVWDIGILNSDPSSAIAEKYQRAQVAVVIADREAEAIRITALAEEDRVTKVYGAIEKHPNGTQIRAYEAVEDSKLTTLAMGERGLALAVPTNQPSKNDQALPASRREGRGEEDSGQEGTGA